MSTISVLIPTYNRSALLREALASVLNQTISDFEVLVIDDGSQEEIEAVVDAFRDERIRYLRQLNQGPCVARNYGIRCARGEWVAFLDSDDHFLPQKLAFQLECLKRNPEAGLVAGGHRMIDQGGAPILERHPWKSRPVLNLETLLNGCPFTINSVLVHKEWLERADGFDPEMRGQAEDWDLWLRLASLGCQMIWSPAIVCTYRMHGQQRVRNGEAQQASILRSFEKLFQMPEFPASMARRHDEVLALAYLSGSMRAYSTGQFACAQDSLSKALGLNPSYLEGKPLKVLSVIGSWAVDPVTGDTVEFIDKVFNHLPSAAASLHEHRNYLMLDSALQFSLLALSSNNVHQSQSALIQAEHVEPAIVNQPGLFIDCIVNQVMQYPTQDQIFMVSRFFEQLPEEWKAYRSLKDRVEARLIMAQGFDDLDHHRSGDAARNFLRGLRRDPTWLANRGVMITLIRYLASRVSGRSVCLL